MSFRIILWYNSDDQFCFNTEEKAEKWRKDMNSLCDGYEDMMAIFDQADVLEDGSVVTNSALLNQMRSWLFGAHRFAEKWGKDYIPKDFQRSINATETVLALPKTKWD